MPSISQFVCTLDKSDPRLYLLLIICRARVSQYHQGFRLQAAGWPQNPVSYFVKYIRSRPGIVVGDFGCGDAKIAQSVSNKVHSFDLVAGNEHVVACDISKVCVRITAEIHDAATAIVSVKQISYIGLSHSQLPLDNAVLDLGIFSLSLMGTNYLDFVKEAARVIKPKYAIICLRDSNWITLCCSQCFIVTMNDQWICMFSLVCHAWWQRRAQGRGGAITV